MKYFLFLVIIFNHIITSAQFNLSSFDKAFSIFEKDSQIQNANVSFCMINNATGKIIFQKKKDMFLPPASTLKTFTTACALHVLGDSFRYKTTIAFKGTIKNNIALGELIIYASGDPSFGSDRFEETKSTIILNKISDALKAKGIKQLKGKITIVNSVYSDTSSNSNWLEEDYGNYYGAGVFPLNWKENKFDIFLKAKDTSFEVVRNDGGLNNNKDFCIELKQQNGASTDESFAYVINSSICKYALRGTLNKSENEQGMGLARINPENDFKNDLVAHLKQIFSVEYLPIDIPVQEEILTTIVSPPLSKLVYWCNQKSLNLYAESFCKTISKNKTGFGDWNNGIIEMKKIAYNLGVDTNSIHLLDASGLAPKNTITTNTLANLLFHYKKQYWFKLFYESIPTINNMTMKSGYIGGTRSYAGYQKLQDGTEVSFAFIVNNFVGKPKTVKEKMFKVLDELKTKVKLLKN